MSREYIKVKDLSEGMLAVTYSEELDSFDVEEIVSIVKLPEKEEVFDIEVEDNHNWVGNKFASSNTRWAKLDPCGVYIQREKDLNEIGKTLRIREICLRSEFDPTDDFEYDFRTFKGEYLWEEISGVAYENAKLAGSMTYNALYMQRPLDDELGIIKKEWLNRYISSEMPDSFSKVVISVDTSYNDTQTSDKAAIGVFGITQNGRVYLLDLTYDRLSYHQTKAKLNEMIAKYPYYSDIVIEVKANGKAIYEDFRDNYSRVMTYEPNESKKSRLMAISPIIEAGGVYLPMNNHGDEMLGQLIDFRGDSKREKDDLVDILVQCLHHCERYFREGFSLNSIKLLNKPSTYNTDEGSLGKLLERSEKNHKKLMKGMKSSKGFQVWKLI